MVKIKENNSVIHTFNHAYSLENHTVMSWITILILVEYTFYLQGLLSVMMMNSGLGCLLSFFFCAAAATTLIKHFVSYLGYLFSPLFYLRSAVSFSWYHEQYFFLTGTLIRVTWPMQIFLVEMLWFWIKGFRYSSATQEDKAITFLIVNYESKLWKCCVFCGAGHVL